MIAQLGSMADSPQEKDMTHKIGENVLALARCSVFFIKKTKKIF
jgi:hypothetical protein